MSISGKQAIVDTLLKAPPIVAPKPYVRETSTAPSSGGFALDSNGVRGGPVMETTRDTDIVGAVPDCCVFVTPTGGPRSTPFGGGGQEEPTSYQVIVRGEPGDFDGADDLADVVYETLNLHPPTGFFESRWYPPHYLRPDDANRHEFVINGMLKRTTA